MDAAVDSAAETALLEVLAALDLGSEHTTAGGGEPLRAGGWGDADLNEVAAASEGGEREEEDGELLEAGLSGQPNKGTDAWGEYTAPSTEREGKPCDAPAGKKDGTPTVVLGKHQHEALRNVWQLFSRKNWQGKTVRQLKDEDVPIERAAMVYHGLGSGKTVVHAAILDFLSQPGFEGWECYNLSTPENTAQHPVSELYQLMGQLSANSAAVQIRCEKKEKEWGTHVRDKIKDLITGRKLEGTRGQVRAVSKVTCTPPPRVTQKTRTKRTKRKTSPTMFIDVQGTRWVVANNQKRPVGNGTLQFLYPQLRPKNALRPTKTLRTTKTTQNRKKQRKPNKQFMSGGGGVESDARHTEYDYFAERMFPRLKIYVTSTNYTKLYRAIGARSNGEVVQSSQNGNYYVLGRTGSLDHKGKEVTNAEQILNPGRLIEIANEVPWFAYSGIPVDEYRRGKVRDSGDPRENETVRYHNAAKTPEDDGTIFGTDAGLLLQTTKGAASNTLKWITGIYPIYRGLMEEGYNQRLKKKVDDFMFDKKVNEYSLGQLYHYLSNRDHPLVIRPLQRTILIIDEMQIMFRPDKVKFAREILAHISREPQCVVIVLSATPASTMKELNKLSVVLNAPEAPPADNFLEKSVDAQANEGRKVGFRVHHFTNDPQQDTTGRMRNNIDPDVYPTSEKIGYKSTPLTTIPADAVTCGSSIVSWHAGHSCFPSPVIRIYAGDHPTKEWAPFLQGRGGVGEESDEKPSLHAVAEVRPGNKFAEKVETVFQDSNKNALLAARNPTIHLSKAPVVAAAIMASPPDTLHYVYMDMDKNDCEVIRTAILEVFKNKKAPLHDYQKRTGVSALKDSTAAFAGGGWDKRPYFQTLYTQDTRDENKITEIEQACAREASRKGTLRVVFTNVSEGVDLKGINFIHVVNWPQSMLSYYQLMGRGPRRCSHTAITKRAWRSVRAIYYEISRSTFVTTEIYHRTLTGDNDGRSKFATTLTRYQLMSAAASILRKTHFPEPHLHAAITRKIKAMNAWCQRVEDAVNKLGLQAVTVGPSKWGGYVEHNGGLRYERGLPPASGEAVTQRIEDLATTIMSGPVRVSHALTRRIMSGRVGYMGPLAKAFKVKWGGKIMASTLYPQLEPGDIPKIDAYVRRQGLSVYWEANAVHDALMARHEECLNDLPKEPDTGFFRESSETEEVEEEGEAKDVSEGEAEWENKSKRSHIRWTQNIEPNPLPSNNPLPVDWSTTYRSMGGGGASSFMRFPALPTMMHFK